MPRDDPGLSAEAREVLRRERRSGTWRSLAIALGFALPASIGFQKQTPIIVTWLAFGIPMGLAMAWLHVEFLERLRHRSFFVTILRQSFAYIALLATCLCTSLFIVLAYSFLTNGRPIGEAWRAWLEVVSTPWFYLAIPGGLLFVVPIRFLFALNQKLGPGTLTKWMRGFYHEPREEERIFMFLDMKDSTTLAEQLGNLKFSALVRDFFQDLTLPVLQTRAEVSHYIGDEAVLTWTFAAGTKEANCLRLFFLFEKSIARRAPHYLSNYGLVPGFKAGSHLGKVVATEVGEIKSEIVYHGDVLNTAARIQGLCNELNEPFLISSELARQVAGSPQYRYKELGHRELKGKAETVGIVAVLRSPLP